MDEITKEIYRMFGEHRIGNLDAEDLKERVLRYDAFRRETIEKLRKENLETWRELQKLKYRS